MGKKFIPNGDWEFLEMAKAFARNVAASCAGIAVSEADSQALTASVERYHEALSECRKHGTRSVATTHRKELARAEAEKLVRRLAHLIRVNEQIDSTTRVLLNLRERPTKLKAQKCPQEPPWLRFVRALHEGSSAMPMHELEFSSVDDWNGPKPAGAVRLELFVDLVPQGEPIPTHPGANHSGRPWYLRSYTRSPIRLAAPLARVPMLVVYWGRWADSTGNVGPFSATVVSRIEGWSPHMMARASLGPPQRAPMLQDATTPGPETRDASYSVAVLDAQYQSLHAPAMMVRQLPGKSGSEARQLEGPEIEEAA